MVNMRTGSIIHIDYGFMLTSRMMNFETAPFKITKDFILLLGGQDADGNDFEKLKKRKGFKKFREYMIQGYKALNEDYEKIMILVHMMGTSQRDLPCFKRGFDTTIAELKSRLTP